MSAGSEYLIHGCLWELTFHHPHLGHCLPSHSDLPALPWTFSGHQECSLHLDWSFYSGLISKTFTITIFKIVPTLLHQAHTLPPYSFIFLLYSPYHYLTYYLFSFYFDCLFVLYLLEWKFMRAEILGEKKRRIVSVPNELSGICCISG